MLQIRLDKVVNQIVQCELLNKGGRKEQALHLHFDLRTSYYAECQSYHASRGLHLLYHVKPGSSYVDVFSSMADSPFDKIQTVKEWKHEISHDSCWRDIQCFSNIYFEMADEVNNAIRKSGGKSVAPINMSECNGFGTLESLYRWVPVRITKKDPSDSYRKTVEIWGCTC